MTTAIRKSIIIKRQQLEICTQKNASFLINNKLINLPIYESSKNVAFYFAFKGEIDLFFIIKNALKNKKNCFFPVIDNSVPHTLKFAKYQQAALLRPNKFGILEPLETNENTLLASQLDLVIMPLVCFDEFCNRMGMGCGFYDKTFAFKKTKNYKYSKPFLIGVAYEFQKTPFILPNIWDITLDMIVTENLNYYNLT